MIHQIVHCFLLVFVVIRQTATATMASAVQGVTCRVGNSCETMTASPYFPFAIECAVNQFIVVLALFHAAFPH